METARGISGIADSVHRGQHAGFIFVGGPYVAAASGRLLYGNTAHTGVLRVLVRLRRLMAQCIRCVYIRIYALTIAQRYRHIDIVPA